MMWRESAAAITLRLENEGLNPFEIVLAGYSVTPPMPQALESALWPEGRADKSLPADSTLQDAADAWAAMIEGGR